MNREQAQKIMNRLAATFTGTPLTPAIIEVWYEAALEGIDYGLGVQTQQRMAQTMAESPFLPPPARFNEVRRAIEAAKEPERPALDRAPQTAQERANVERFQALCRQVIAERDRRPHWHGGPDPCVVCGGLNPKVAAKQAKERGA